MIKRVFLSLLAAVFLASFLAGPELLANSSGSSTDAATVGSAITSVAMPSAPIPEQPAAQPKPEPVAVPSTPAVAAATTPTTNPTPPAPSTPYSLTTAGVSSDLAALGYSLTSVEARFITVRGHNGAIPKRCSASGVMGNYTSQGLAVRNITYAACNNGQQPLYDAYSVDGFACTVLYNRQSSKKLAILAHELAHCFYHDHGEYGDFDIEYKKLRDAYDVSQQGLKELMADDFMICRHGLDTNWSGNANYYTRFGKPRPTAEVCAAYNVLVDKYLI